MNTSTAPDILVWLNIQQRVQANTEYGDRLTYGINRECPIYRSSVAEFCKNLRNFGTSCLAVVGRGVLERAVSIPYLFVMFFTAWIFSI